MKQGGFQPALDALIESSPPRVWSLIVTVFGDLAQDAGDAISGPMLSNILTPIGIRPEAMRVALHRLRNDGWLTARKDGRTSLHLLAPHGQALSAQARELIYRRDHPASAQWHILCLPPEQGTKDLSAMAGYTKMSAGVYLANTPAPSSDADAFVLDVAPGSVPPWVMQAALPKGLTSQMKDLHATLDVFLNELAPSPDLSTELSAQQIACLRVLIVHRWRRLILKVPNVPDVLFGDDWVGLACRDLVHQALDRLPRPSLSDLA